MRTALMPSSCNDHTFQLGSGEEQRRPLIVEQKQIKGMRLIRLRGKNKKKKKRKVEQEKTLQPSQYIVRRWTVRVYFPTREETEYIVVRRSTTCTPSLYFIVYCSIYLSPKLDLTVKNLNLSQEYLISVTSSKFQWLCR